MLIQTRILSNENSHNGNQKATSECDVSFKQILPRIILSCNFFRVYSKQIFRLRLAVRTSESKASLGV